MEVVPSYFVTMSYFLSHISLWIKKYKNKFWSKMKFK